MYLAVTLVRGGILGAQTVGSQFELRQCDIFMNHVVSPRYMTFSTVFSAVELESSAWGGLE